MEKSVEFRNKKSSSRDNNEVMNETKIVSLNELNTGDHIVLISYEDQTKFSHAILTGIKLELSLIEIVYYGNGTELIKNFIKDDSDSDKNQIAVKKNNILIDLQQLDIFRLEYEPFKCLTADETCQNAEKLIGKTKYNTFVNNDEHFCVYCKTGKAGKLFILKPDLSKEVVLSKTFNNLSSACVTNLASQGGQIMLVNTAKHIATSFPRSAVGHVLPEVTSAACSGIGAGIEAISTGYDIYKKNKAYKEGRCNTIMFKKYVATRVTRGAMSATGGVIGGVLGQLVIPIPVAGAVIGGVLGGLTGAALGHLEGLLLGELVEIVDLKLKKLMTPKLETICEIGNNDEIKETDVQIKHPYHVLHHLVFMFKKDILNESNFEHLKSSNSVFYTDKEIVSETFNKLINNAEEKINEDDYEIYVINKDSDEVVNLDLGDSITTNGRIMSRFSVEEFSADQLPSDVNVFFRCSQFNDSS